MQNQLYILGSSSALPTSERFPSSQVLSMNGKLFLIDCGEGTQIRLRQMKIRMQQIGHIFISHLHGDHYLGIMGLISTLNLLGRKTPLYIHAFEPLERVIQLQIEVTGLILSYKIIFCPLDNTSQNLIFEDKAIAIYSFPLKHRIACCGFLFKSKTAQPNIKKEFIAQHQIPTMWFKRIKEGEDYIAADGKVYRNADITIPPPKPVSYAYCSDTIYDKRITEYIKNVTLLYHEASFADDMLQLAKEKFHSTASQAARIAKESNVHKLLIGHFSARYKELTVFLNQSRAIFPNTYLAEDLSVISF